MTPSTFSARDAQRKFGYLLQVAISLPVTIEKHGRPVAVILSSEEFNRLQEIEDSYWIERAKKAEKKGYLSTKKSKDLIQEMLDA